ncbi:MAG: DUF4340 domain-containing protein [Anaerolineae bacterium]|jgi:hypothetical protein|nr:DUF4340 domain-containing protein [Anaerolineae bacterium]
MKRTTLVVLAIFAVLLVLLIIMDTNDIALLAQTPSPTAQMQVLGDWSVDDIVMIEYHSINLDGISIQKNTDNSWSFPASTNLVDQGKIQELLSTLQSMVVLTDLDPSPELKSIGLTTPQYVVVLTNTSKEKKEIWVGNITPTGSGYYVTLNNGTPIVISKYAIDSILELLTPSNLILQTVTPEGS